ncbi:MAG TPA: hypothetical protein VMI12_09235 [Puia sp.]|nr:hypothetical protein [Puia sp.]
MFENKHQPIAPIRVYRRRIAKCMATGIFIIFGCLILGILGYHWTGEIPWLDSLHNASMILSGMGPVVEIKTVGGKWFSSFYALFSGVVFITNIGIILAPAIHRFFHRLHLEAK